MLASAVERNAPCLRFVHGPGLTKSVLARFQASQRWPLMIVQVCFLVDMPLAGIRSHER